MTKRTLMRIAFEDDSGQALVGLNDPLDGVVQVCDDDLQQAHEDVEKIDELISLTSCLEEIEQATKQASELDGLSAGTAKALDTSFEHFKQLAGLPTNKSLSLEGFSGGKQTRIQATKVALEEIGETIRRMVRKLIEWIKHIATVCYDMVDRLLNGANAVIHKAQQLHRAALSISHHRFDNEKIGDISKSGLVSFFNKNGRPMSGHEIGQLFLEYSKEVDTLFSAAKLYTPATYALGEIERFVRGQGEKSLDVAQMELFAAEACNSLAQSSLAQFNVRAQGDGDVLVKELPFGNSELVFSFIHGSSNPQSRIGFNVAIKPADEQSNAPALTPMRPQEVANLMSHVISQMGKGVYRDSKRIKAGIHEIQTRIEKESYRLSDRQRLAGASVIPTLHLIKAVADSSMKITRLLYSYTGITTRRMLWYAQSSIQAYEGAIVK